MTTRGTEITDGSPSSWDGLSDLIATSPEVWGSPDLLTRGMGSWAGTVDVVPDGGSMTMGLRSDHGEYAATTYSSNPTMAVHVDVAQCVPYDESSSQIFPLDLVHQSPGTQIEYFGQSTSSIMDVGPLNTPPPSPMSMLNGMTPIYPFTPTDNATPALAITSSQLL